MANEFYKDDPKYFAAKNPEETARILLGKADSFYNALRSNSYLDKIWRMWRAYHGAYHDDMQSGHRINFTGEQGELVQLPVNHFGNLAQHIIVMITANRPTMEARSINSDYKSQAQTIIANGVLDYYMREKRLEDHLKKAVEMAVVLGSGFIKLEWNATAGDAYDVNDETGEIHYEGELEFTNLSPLDVVVDGTKESWNNDWLLVRSFQNRFNLIAKYPELADKIRSIPPKNQNVLYKLAIFSNDDTDDIPVYEFYHKRTEAMPDGRYMLFLESDVVLLDTKLPYRTIPIYRIAPRDILGTPYGYTPMFDVFPVQEAINSTYSTIMTNQNAFGVQNLFVPRGADISVNTLDGAMNVIEGNAKPEPLNLTETPAEVFKYLEILIQTAETLSGVNSVARGNPEASLKSGTALALVQSMALQFISGLQQSYVKLIEDVGTGLIQILKDFSSTPKTIALIGKNNKYLLSEFTGEKISAINRVVVDVGNPLSRTTAGRVQMAEQMLQMGLLKSPQEYFQVINTGRLEVVYEGELSEQLLVKDENEKLLSGDTVIATVLDQHRYHILEHKAVLADTDLRKDHTLVKKVLDHIQQHIDLLRNADPDLLMLIGEQPLAPAGMVPENMGPQQPVVPKNMNNSEMLAPNNTIVGPNNLQGAEIPQPARPPEPFENLPISAQELTPQ